MPLFRTEANYEYVAASSFSALGKTPVEVVTTFISNPLKVLSTIFQSTKAANAFMLFLPLLFISHCNHIISGTPVIERFDSDEALC